jgi:hypothetical protein
MVLNQNLNSIETNIEGEQKSFTIKTTAKAFKILSSGLYSDKIKAIIRELACNAWDAHVICKNKTPFIVHLPSIAEPWFSVRDFGTGLSENDITNLYSTYFDSNKSYRNDQIGAMGLGSKSPFSYTDSFNIESRFNNTETLYTAFISDIGIPTIIKTFQSHTDEHNGIEIKFAVSKNDFEEFAQKAGVVFRIFENKPQVIGNNKYKEYEQSLIQVLSGTNWKYYKTNFYTPERAVAIQGNVEYPIDINQLGTLTSNQKFILQNKFYMYFNIGELDIAASREGLGYDEPTIANIKERVNFTFNSFIIRFKNEIKKAPSLWEAYISIANIAKEIDFNASKLYDIKFSYKGKSFSINECLNYKIPKGSKFCVSVYFCSAAYNASNRLKFNNEYKEEREISINPLEKELFLVQDENITEYKRMCKIKKVARENKGSKIFFLNSFSQEFFDAIGNPPFIKSSEIEVQKKVTKKGKAVFPNNYFIIKTKDNVENISYSEIKPGKQLYVSWINHEYCDSNRKRFDLYNILLMFDFLKKEKLIDANKTLYAVKPCEMETKRFKSLEWQDFIETGSLLIKNYINNNINHCSKMMTQYFLEQSVQDMDYHLRNLFIKEYKEHKDDYKANSLFLNIAEMITNHKSVSRKEDIILINDCFNIVDIKFKCDFDIIKLYPMFKLINNWSYKTGSEETIIDYIKLIDKHN